MQKIFALLLLMCIAASTVISQEKKPTPSPSQDSTQTKKPTDKPVDKPTKPKKAVAQTTAKQVEKNKRYRRHHHRWMQIAKLRKENKRLRALLARQKRNVHRRNSRKNTAQRVRSSQPGNRPATVVNATAQLTDDQLDTIANKVTAKLKSDGVPVKLSKEDLNTLAAAIAKDESSAVKDPSKADDAKKPDDKSSEPGFFAGIWNSTKDYASSAWSWVTENPYTSLLTLLAAIFIFFTPKIYRKVVGKKTVSLKPSWVRQGVDRFTSWRKRDKGSGSIVENLYSKVGEEAEAEAANLDDEEVEAGSQVYDLRTS